MEGISTCGAASLSLTAMILPKLRNPPSASTTDPSVIDLSDAENQIQRCEIAEITRKSFGPDFDSSLLDWPKGFYGDPKLVGQFIDIFNTFFHPHEKLGTEHVVVAPGAAACLEALLYDICEPGDGVLVPQPYWNGYDYFFSVHSQVKAVGVAVDCLEDYVELPLIDALERALQSASCPVKGLVISNPHNPLGRCYSKSLLEECLKFCQRHGIHLISDEVFALNTLMGASNRHPQWFVSVLNLNPESLGCDESRVHVIWSLSKVFGVSGIRLGCVATRNDKIRDGVALLGPQSVSTLSTVVGRSLLDPGNSIDLLQSNWLRLAQRYNTLTAFFERVGIAYLPCNTTIVMMARLAPGAQTWEDEAKACQKYAEAGVVLAPGRRYHMTDDQKGWMRILFAVDEQRLNAAMERIAPVYKKLTKS